MGESLLLITLITLIVLTICRAKPVVLKNPVIIQRPGQYHITLAPQLNRAQTFIEQVARKFSQTHSPQGNIPSQYFEVRDPKVYAQDQSCYLLSAALHDGLLYFQAVNPRVAQQDSESHLKMLRELSESVSAAHPLSGPADGLRIDEPGAKKLCEAVAAVANDLKITATVLRASV